MKSSWTLFIESINKKMNRSDIVKLFKKVDKKDYEKKDKDRLIEYAFSLVN